MDRVEKRDCHQDNGILDGIQLKKAKKIFMPSGVEA